MSPVVSLLERRTRHESSTRSTDGTSPLKVADTAAVAPTDSTRRARQPPLPARLSLGESLSFPPRRVVLVSYDIEQRRLVVRTGPAAPAE